MRKLIALIAVFMTASFGQITLNPGQQYKFESTMYAYNERQVLKIDSLFKSLDATNAQLNSLRLQIKVSDELIDSLRVQAQLFKQRDMLNAEKIHLMSINDSLSRADAKLYRDMYIDISHVLSETAGSKPNATLWFALGAVSGSLVVYLSSLVLHNIGN